MVKYEKHTVSKFNKVPWYIQKYREIKHPKMISNGLNLKANMISICSMTFLYFLMQNSILSINIGYPYLETLLKWWFGNDDLVDVPLFFYTTWFYNAQSVYLSL